MKTCMRVLILLACGLAVPSAAHAQAYTLRDLLNKVPEDVNSLVVIHVPTLHRSALGRQENWSKRHDAAFQAGKVPFPPQTIMLVMAGHASTDPQRHHGPEIGLLSLSASIPFKELAEYEQGITEEVASTKVVLTPRNVYIASLSQRLVAIQRPASRQSLSRWLSFAKRSKNPVLHEWLHNAANELGKAGQIIMAIHLEDAVDVRRVRERLGQMQKAMPEGTNLDELAAALASVRGLRLAINVNEDIQGEVRIEFNKPVKAFGELLHPILAQGVDNLGEGLPHLKDWKMEVEDQVVIFRSPLTREGFTDLLASLAPQAAPAGLGADEQAPGGNKAFAARRYLQQVTTQLDELRKLMERMNDYNVAAKTCEDYALKIERLPAYGVEEDLLAYATGLTGKLRTVAESLRGVPITAAVLEASRDEKFYYQPPQYVNTGGWYGRGGRRGGYGGGGRMGRGGLFGNYGGGGSYIPQQAAYESNLPELRGKLAEAIVKDQQNREKIWKSIDADTARIKDKLMKQFPDEFNK